jgi:hypothetical protein
MPSALQNTTEPLTACALQQPNSIAVAIFVAMVFGVFIAFIFSLLVRR